MTRKRVQQPSWESNLSTWEQGAANDQRSRRRRGPRPPEGMRECRRVGSCGCIVFMLEAACERLTRTEDDMLVPSEAPPVSFVALTRPFDAPAPRDSLLVTGPERLRGDQSAHLHPHSILLRSLPSVFLDTLDKCRQSTGSYMARPQRRRSAPGRPSCARSSASWTGR